MVYQHKMYHQWSHHWLVWRFTITDSLSIQGSGWLGVSVMVNHHTHKYAVMEKLRNHPVMEMTYLLDGRGQSQGRVTGRSPGRSIPGERSEVDPRAEPLVVPREGQSQGRGQRSIPGQDHICMWARLGFLLVSLKLESFGVHTVAWTLMCGVVIDILSRYWVSFQLFKGWRVGSVV